MIHDMVEAAYLNAKKRGWDKIYIAVDIHDTIAESNYKNTLPDVYPEAIVAIKYLQSLPECVLILFSSCYEKDYETYMKHFESFGLKFDYFNENPQVPNTATGDFTKKFYYNMIIDDKAGFRPKHWNQVIEYVAMFRHLIGGV